ncbi:hypothetical protein ARD30_07955 [Bosea thiooxidans]|uniref:Uncharacterized protein n=1 Tax=Bosea thiooxidans TaxID=53254 RepID=A0A0Q3L5N3_9HYPH|nr:hypothetical protein ARD30_07955 [Bosea thiooxidans]
MNWAIGLAYDQASGDRCSCCRPAETSGTQCHQRRNAEVILLHLDRLLSFLEEAPRCLNAL